MKQEAQHKANIYKGTTGLPGWGHSLLQDTQHINERSITDLPGWSTSPLHDAQHDITRSIVHLPGWDVSYHVVTITELN